MTTILAKIDKKLSLIGNRVELLVLSFLLALVIGGVCVLVLLHRL
jgi:hypothetical protein